MSYLNSPPPLLFFIPLSVIPETVLSDIIFAFIHMCIHLLNLPPTFPTLPPDITCSALLFSDFIEEKT
jgi:hypothetical protein